jgi:hypothetical protein
MLAKASDPGFRVAFVANADEPQVDLLSKLKAEILPADYQAMRAHVSRQALYLVAAALALPDVAHAVALDRTTVIAYWLQQALLRKPTEAEVADWEAAPNEERFEFVIVQPYVLAKLKHQA